MVCLEGEEPIERYVAFHLGILSRRFASGVRYESSIGNADETHFLINLDNHRTLGRCGENEFKDADFVSDSEGTTIKVRISGGRDAIIENEFLVFQNKHRSYPIQGMAYDKYGFHIARPRRDECLEQFLSVLWREKGYSCITE